MPNAEALASATAKPNALALQAVRALLAEERDRAARALPSSDPDWRLLLALYEAELDARALTPAEAAEAAAIPPQSVEATAHHFETEDFLAPRAQGGALRLTEEACEHLAVWVYALNPLPGFTPYRAAAGAPPPEPPPEPPG
jgi:predicted membrane-bound mannosyltransferase